MTLQLLHLKNYPIFKQLQLEEALLRASDNNYCIINEGTSPAIVLGISSVPEKLIHLESIKNLNIPIIQRFSGGGCVIVDAGTLFITLIFAKKDLDIPPFPESILRWSESIYKGAFPSSFCLQENDYCLGNQKCGGNAQYIQKDRWLHHTSFLWDYKDKQMNLLTFPEKTPAYRKKRNHLDFLCRLKEHFQEKEQLISSLKNQLQKMFSLSETSLAETEPFLEKPHRKSTKHLLY